MVVSFAILVLERLDTDLKELQAVLGGLGRKFGACRALVC